MDDHLKQAVVEATGKAFDALAARLDAGQLEELFRHTKSGRLSRDLWETLARVAGPPAYPERGVPRGDVKEDLVYD